MLAGVHPLRDSSSITSVVKFHRSWIGNPIAARWDVMPQSVTQSRTREQGHQCPRLGNGTDGHGADSQTRTAIGEGPCSRHVGRLGGLKGGAERAAALSPRKQSAIARKERRRGGKSSYRVRRLFSAGACLGVGPIITFTVATPILKRSTSGFLNGGASGYTGPKYVASSNAFL